MNVARLLTLASLIVVPAVAQGCTVQHQDDGPGDGSVTVDWTIADSKSASECDTNDVTEIQVTVIDSGGANFGTFTEACSSFATSISLPEGDYTANAVLVDASGHPRTTAIPMDGIRIIAGTDLNVPIDFPPDSFE